MVFLALSSISGETLRGVYPARLNSKEGIARKKICMTDNLVRPALGLEDVDDLIADLEQALEKI